MGTVWPATETFTSTSTPSSLPSCCDWSPSCSDPGDPGAPWLEAVSELLESPSLDDERLLLDEELLEELLLELDGNEGVDAVEEGELDGIEGIEGIDAVEDDDELDGDRDEDDDEEELGIDGEDDGEEDDDELGMDGMPLLLLELCWVDSQPARTRASTEAPT
jgi:hypothetical protein